MSAAFRLYCLAGVGWDLLVLWDVAKIGPALGFLPSADLHGEAPITFLAIFFGIFLIFGIFFYVKNLDVFRPARPWWVPYLTFLPPSLMGGAFGVFMFSTGPVSGPDPLVIAAGLALGVLAPAAVVGAEAILWRALLAVGFRLEKMDWREGATYFLSRGLLWRPSIDDVMRRCGLLLVELGRFKEALQYLERLGAIEDSDDYEVIQALEKTYLAEGRAESAVRCLERERELKPQARGMDRRLLNLYLKHGESQKAISLIESGRIPMDLDLLCALQGLYFQSGNIAQALARATQIAQQEPPPFERSIELHEQLLEKIPNNIELLIDLGLLLQKTENPANMKRGAEYLEQAIAREPRRLHLRRRLAVYYNESGEYQQAEKHYCELIDGGDLDPETYLNYAAMLKSEGMLIEAHDVYQEMQVACEGEWRAHAEDAGVMLKLDRIDEAERQIEKARELPEAESGIDLDLLQRRIDRRREEKRLDALSKELSSQGADLKKRLDYVRKLMALDRGDRAIDECDDLIEQFPELLGEIQRMLEEGLPRVEHSYRLRDYLADLYFRQELYDSALAMFTEMAEQSLNRDRVMEDGCKKVLMKAPDHLASRLTLGQIYYNAERWDDLLRLYGPLIEQKGSMAPVLIQAQWSEAAYHKGMVKEASEIGCAILEDMEDDIDFMLLLIRALEDRGHYNEAYEVFKVAYRNFPDDETLRKMERTVADNKKRERMEALKAVADRGELELDEHYEIADLYREFGQFQQAIVHYQQASEDPKRFDESTAKIAVCLCERRLFELADETLSPIKLTKEKVAKNQKLKNLFYHVAQVLEAEGCRDEARKYYKRIFRIDASFRDIVRRLEKLGED